MEEPTRGRLAGKVAIVAGAGQTPGETIGNGRATARLFAREGARVLCVDRDGERAAATASEIESEGGEAAPIAADVSIESDCARIARDCVERYGRIDVLHNNVGIGDGDAGPTSLEEKAWDHIFDVNLKSVFLTCKHVLPLMREQHAGVVINVSSVAAVASTGMVAYKTSKAAVNAYTQALANSNARHGVRAVAIMPGLMNTPMAIEGLSRARGIPREELIRQRDALVPLRGGMGSAWDVAHAALFLASDEARFITGVVLAVDGGQSARVG